MRPVVLISVLLVLLPVAILGHTRFARNDNPDVPTDYSQHKVIRILPSAAEHVPVLRKLEEEFEMDYWNPVLKDLRPVLTILDPQRAEFLTELNKANIAYEVVHQNYQKVVDAERSEMQAVRSRERSLGMNFNEDYDYENSYHTYAEITAQLKFLATKYASTAQYISVGNSYEGREIPALIIGSGSKVIILENGIHAREWVTPAFGVWVANYLLSQASLASYLTQYKFIVVPTLNVDGYVFTHTTTRLWRKTRSRLASGSTCYGADPNRNWDSSWSAAGASSNPCSETYYGVAPFSEVEAKAMADLTNQYRGNIAAYFAIHSYSQLWMYPYGNTTALPPNNDKLKSLSQAALTAIRAVNGLVFVEGTIANAIYLSSGSSADWAYEKAGVQISFAIELRDKGEYGFQLPASQIRPAVYETWAGVKAVIDNL